MILLGTCRVLRIRIIIQRPSYKFLAGLYNFLPPPPPLPPPLSPPIRPTTPPSPISTANLDLRSIPGVFLFFFFLYPSSTSTVFCCLHRQRLSVPVLHSHWNIHATIIRHYAAAPAMTAAVPKKRFVQVKRFPRCHFFLSFLFFFLFVLDFCPLTKIT